MKDQADIHALMQDIGKRAKAAAALMIVLGVVLTRL